MNMNQPLALEALQAVASGISACAITPAAIIDPAGSLFFKKAPATD